MSENNKTKIGYIVNYFDPAGLENFVLSLINNLDTNKFIPALYILYKSDKQFLNKLKEGTKIVHVHRKPGNNFEFLFGLSKELKESNTNIIQVNNWGTFIEGALLKILNPSLSLIHVQHGIEYELTLKAGIFKKLIRKFTRHLLVHLFDRIVGCSIKTQNYLKKEWGAYDARLIYNGVDTTKFNGEKNDLGIIKSKSTFKICTIGRLVPVKNFMCLFKALKIISSRIPSAQLFHFGTKPPGGTDVENELRDYINQNELENNIIFLGNKSDIHKLLGNFDVFALTSLSEGLSFAIIEAQSSGLPAVVTNVGGNPEIIEDGVNGFLIDSDNETDIAAALIKLYEDIELRKKMSENAKRIMKEKFDLRRMVRQYQDMYMQLNRE